jgi:hypothetical protein
VFFFFFFLLKFINTCFTNRLHSVDTLKQCQTITNLHVVLTHDVDATQILESYFVARSFCLRDDSKAVVDQQQRLFSEWCDVIKRNGWRIDQVK